MHPDHEAFSVEIPGNDPEAMEKLQELMDCVHDAYEVETKKIAAELNISEDCALDVLYLRSRSRWTPALEKHLIQLHKEGNPPDMNEYGNNLNVN